MHTGTVPIPSKKFLLGVSFKPWPYERLIRMSLGPNSSSRMNESTTLDKCPTTSWWRTETKVMLNRLNLILANCEFVNNGHGDKSCSNVSHFYYLCTWDTFCVSGSSKFERNEWKVNWIFPFILNWTKFSFDFSIFQSIILCLISKQANEN